MGGDQDVDTRTGQPGRQAGPDLRTPRREDQAVEPERADQGEHLVGSRVLGQRGHHAERRPGCAGQVVDEPAGLGGVAEDGVPLERHPQRHQGAAALPQDGAAEETAEEQAEDDQPHPGPGQVAGQEQVVAGHEDDAGQRRRGEDRLDVRGAHAQRRAPVEAARLAGQHPHRRQGHGGVPVPRDVGPRDRRRPLEAEQEGDVGHRDDGGHVDDDEEGVRAPPQPPPARCSGACHGHRVLAKTMLS